MSDIMFVSGMRVYRPRENAPEFVKADIVCNVDELADFLKTRAVDGKVRIQIKEGKSGNYYASVDMRTSAPQPTETRHTPSEEEIADSVPF